MAPLRMPQTPMSALGLGPTLPRVAAQQAQRERERLRRKRVVLIVTALCVLALLFELSQWTLGSARAAEERRAAQRAVDGALESRQRGAAQLESERRQQQRAASDRRGFRDNKQLVLLLAHFRDADACAQTLADAHARAYLPARVHFRVVDEVDVGVDDSCVQRFCAQQPVACRELLRAGRLRFATRDASGARGMTVARNLVENMVTRREFGDDFYVSVDAGVSFAQDWDLALLKQWYSIGNDMAILSSAPKALVLKDRRSSVATFLLQCSAHIHSKASDAVVEFNPPEPRPKVDAALFAPVLQAQYTEVFHFGPVSALLAVRSDPHTPFVTVGHEYARASRFWTHGYDFYAPVEDIVFATYAWQPTPVSSSEKDTAAHVQRANKRIRRLLKLPVSASSAEETVAIAVDEDKFALGTRRSMAQWQSFSKIDPVAPYNESTTNQFVACFDKLQYVGYQF